MLGITANLLLLLSSKATIRELPLAWIRLGEADFLLTDVICILVMLWFDIEIRIMTGP